MVATMILRMIGTPVFSDQTEFSVTTRPWALSYNKCVEKNAELLLSHGLYVKNVYRRKNI